MINKVNFSEVQAIDSEIQSMKEDAIKTQNVTYLMELGLRLSSLASFASQEKVKADINYTVSLEESKLDIRALANAKGDKYSDTAIEKMAVINCIENKYIHDSIAATHRSCEKTQDFIRTCISALKAEMAANQYQNNQL